MSADHQEDSYPQGTHPSEGGSPAEAIGVGSRREEPKGPRGCGEPVRPRLQLGGAHPRGFSRVRSKTQRGVVAMLIQLQAGPQRE